jgi:hypothetical protein
MASTSRTNPSPQIEAAVEPMPSTPSSPLVWPSKTHNPLKLECFARLSDSKTIEIKLQQTPGLSDVSSEFHTPMEVIDMDSESSEEPVIVDLDSNTLLNDHVETFFSSESDSLSDLKWKLEMASKEIHQLKKSKEESATTIARLTKDLSKARGELAHAKQALQTVSDGNNFLLGPRTPGSPSSSPLTPPVPSIVNKPLPWSEEEVEVLKIAVAECGVGQWKPMHEKFKDQFHPERTRIQIRDRYRFLKQKGLWK